MGNGEEEEDLSPAPAAHLTRYFSRRGAEAQRTQRKKKGKSCCTLNVLNKIYLDVFLQPVAAEIQPAQLCRQWRHNSKIAKFFSKTYHSME